MKVPLRFQVTEFDCGTVSLLNAFSYLFDRKEIPAELVKAIHSYTLDCYDEYGNIGQGGTSREAINKLSHWIERYSKKKDFGVHCERLEKEDVNLENIKKCLKNNGVVFARCWMEVEHYVIITKIDSKRAYIFDPYYVSKGYYNRDKDIRIVLSKPFNYNRVVKLSRLFSETKRDLSLGEISMRECVLINKIRR